MRYVLPIIVMCMSVLMIVCTREESIKWGTIIFGCSVAYLFVLSKFTKGNTNEAGTPRRSNQAHP